jgi:D-alanyl-D-alanine carboxypeptidase
MNKVIGSIISFLISTFSIFNIEEIPQTENIDNEQNDQIISNVLDITDIKIDMEDIQPKKIENTTTTTNSNSSTTDWWAYPSNIKKTVRSGNDLLVLVNKEYQLPSSYAPSDLVKVGDDVIRRGSSYYLRSIVINDLKALVNAAESDGIDLSIVSAYRSYSTQASTYQYWVNYNNGCIPCADRISARAGHSQHQLGTTLDFSSNEVNDSLGTKFADTKASDWLKANAYKYGFVIGFPQGYESVTGYSYEAWHYRYIGKTNALEMKNSGKILEIYLRGKN